MVGVVLPQFAHHCLAARGGAGGRLRRGDVLREQLRQLAQVSGALVRREQLAGGDVGVRDCEAALARRRIAAAKLDARGHHGPRRVTGLLAAQHQGLFWVARAIRSVRGGSENERGDECGDHAMTVHRHPTSWQSLSPFIDIFVMQHTLLTSTTLRARCQARRATAAR